MMLTVMQQCVLCFCSGMILDSYETGSARTSLIITIGPSSRHHAETTSTIMFGQRVSYICTQIVAFSSSLLILHISFGIAVIF